MERHSMEKAQADVVGQLAMALGRPGGALAAWIGMTDPAVTALLARAGFDTVVLDMQHGAFEVATGAAAIGAAALAGVPAMVRIPVGDNATASRLLDAGAAGIIAPMIDTAAEAAAFVEACRYPPLGRRSWGPRAVLDLAGLGGDAYFAAANRLHRTFAMIETRQGLDNLEAILAVPGLDGVFVGPSDLSVALTGAVDPGHAQVEAALDHVAAHVRAHGKVAGVFCFTGAKARAMVGRGYALCSIATDGLLMQAAARSELAAARG